LRIYVLKASVDVVCCCPKEILGCFLIRTVFLVFSCDCGISLISAIGYARRHGSFLLVPKEIFLKTKLASQTDFPNFRRIVLSRVGWYA
jgi:hypothetical protein